jgi:sarcosine/dimethylglycine N-methyltransferase
MTVPQVHEQYSTGRVRASIEAALVAAGKNLDHLQPGELALLEDFHTLGRLATHELARHGAITTADTVLDAGSAIGGTARFLADTYGCRVEAVDSVTSTARSPGGSTN